MPAERADSPAKVLMPLRIGDPESVTVGNNPGHAVGARHPRNRTAETYGVHVLVEPKQKLPNPRVGLLTVVGVQPRHRPIGLWQSDPDPRDLTILLQFQIDAMIDDVDDSKRVLRPPALRYVLDGA
jgi:hypothetical protein